MVLQNLVRRRQQAAPASPEAAKIKQGCAESRRQRSDLWIVSLFLVYFTVFVDFLGVGLLIPILPFLVGLQPHEESFSKDQMGGLDPGAAASLILLTFNIGLLISTLIFGPVSDKIGRKPMLCFSLVGGAIGYGVTGLAIFVDSFWMMLAGRCVTGLCGGSRPVAIAYIADAAPAAQRSKLLGFLALSVTFAILFGPVLGGSLGQVDLQLPCYVAAGCSGAGAVLLIALLQEARPQTGKDGEAGGADDAKGDGIAYFMVTIMSFFFGIWIIASVFSMSMLMPLKFDFDPNQVGLASLGDGMALLLSTPIYMFLIKRIRLPAVCAIGFLVSAITPIIPYVELEPLLVVRYIGGLGSSTAGPAVTAIVGAIAPASKRGSWSGTVIAMQSLGRVVSPVFIGWAFDADYKFPFWIMGGLSVCMSIVAMTLIPMVPMESGVDAVKKEEAIAAGSASVDEEGGGRARSESDWSSQTEALIDQLRLRRQHWQNKLESASENKAQEKVAADLPAVPAEMREEAMLELGRWMASTLEERGYVRWAEHVAGIKLILTNSFPPIRTDSSVNAYQDLIALYEGHILMAESHEPLKGLEDIAHFVPKA